MFADKARMGFSPEIFFKFNSCNVHIVAVKYHCFFVVWVLLVHVTLGYAVLSVYLLQRSYKCISCLCGTQ